MAEKRQRTSKVGPWVWKEPGCGFTIIMTGRDPDVVLDAMNQHRLTHRQKEEPIQEPELERTIAEVSPGTEIGDDSQMAALVAAQMEVNKQLAEGLNGLAQQVMSMNQTILNLQARAEAEMQAQNQPQQSPVDGNSGQRQPQYVVPATPQPASQNWGLSDLIQAGKALGIGGGGSGSSSMDGFLQGVDQMAKFKEAMDRLTAPDRAREISNLNYLATLMKMANQSGIDTGPMLDQVVQSTQHQLDNMKQSPQPAPEKPNA